MRSSLLSAALLAALLQPGGAAAEIDCSGTHLGTRTATATGVADPAGDMRVFAIQYRQDLAYVESYESFRRKMECLFLDYVIPNRSPTLPNVVVLNEDIGLATLGIGTRGLGARTIAALPVKDPQNLVGAIAALGSVGAGYGAQVAYYAAREPQTGAQRLILAAATDTFVRAFIQTFSDLARRYGLYIVASNNQAEFREVRVADQPAAAALVDPDLLPRYLSGELTTVYEAVDDVGPGPADPDAGLGAAGMNIHNKAFMWSPYAGVEPYAAARFSRFALDAEMTPADPRSNLVAAVKKTPLTTTERTLLDITDDGDMSVENTGPFPLAGAAPLAEPPLPPAARIGFGISLPGFKWGNDFGRPFTGDGCASSNTWMRCLDQRGMNVFLQPEANSGCCWVDYIDAGWSPPAWQALSWMDSAWRAVADPSVQNIRYAITPHLVGNLVDLAFDGQSVIFERCTTNGTDTCAGNTAQAFVGANDFIACPQELNRCDDPRLAPYAGAKRETIVMAPWVLADYPALTPIENRARLAARGHEMLAGSGSPFENGYLETAIWADLDL